MKSFGYHQAVFTRAMWDKWLTRLNAPAPDPQLARGVEEMRRLLQRRCIGAMQESIETTATYRAFVERQFGSAK